MRTSPALALVEVTAPQNGTDDEGYGIVTDDSYTRRLCVVGLADGQVLIKGMTPGFKRGLWHLESNTEPTIFDAKVKWAAKVREMRPR